MKNKSEWHIYDYDFAIHAADMYYEGAKQINVLACMNLRTGEVKIFSRKTADLIGKDGILKLLAPRRPARKATKKK